MGDRYLVATRVDDEAIGKIQKACVAMTWSTAELIRKILESWDGDPWPLVRPGKPSAGGGIMKYQKRKRGSPLRS